MTIAQQARYRSKLQKMIAWRSSIPNRGAIIDGLLQREKERYLASHAVQSMALLDGWRHSLEASDANQRWTLAQRAPICPYDYRRFQPEPVSFFHKPRSTGGVRKICCFGDVERMWHVMARDLIVAQHLPRPHIGDWAGRGRDWQVDLIRSALTSPSQAVVSADIVKAFASVNIDAVYGLPYLPEPLIRRVIDAGSHRFVRRERSEYAAEVYNATRNHDDDVLERSPSGLMEGSPASNAVFSVLMDDLPDHLDEEIHTFIYCDNIILIAPSMPCALRARDALARYLAGHRAGPFEMRSLVASVQERFEHLGYTFRRQPALPPDVGISRRGWLKLVDRLFADPPDLEGAVRWLKASYGRCHHSSLAEFLQLAGVDAAKHALIPTRRCTAVTHVDPHRRPA